MAPKSSLHEAEAATQNVSCKNPGGPFVQLVVGPEKMVFTIRRNLLCRHSDVFNNALTGTWAEAKISTLELPDTDPEVVESFLIWAHGGHMLGPKFALELYVFADKYQIVLLKADAAHTLYWHWTTWNRRAKAQRIVQAVIPDANIINFALDNLLESNRIVQLLRVVHNLWDVRLSDRRYTPAMRRARSRLLSTPPYGPIDRIGPEYAYYADAKPRGAMLGCPHALTSKTNMMACYDCLWLAEVKPWLKNRRL